MTNEDDRELFLFLILIKVVFYGCVGTLFSAGLCISGMENLHGHSVGVF